MKSDSITRCPRCGDEDTRLERTTYEGEPSYYIYCGGCGFEDDFGEEVNKCRAIDLWNEKYPDLSSAAGLASLQTSPETWLKSNQISRPDILVNAVMVQIIEAAGDDGERRFQKAVSILCKDEHMLPALEEEARRILRS